jgi:hypothetical protein
VRDVVFDFVEDDVALHALADGFGRDVQDVPDLPPGRTVTLRVSTGV